MVYDPSAKSRSASGVFPRGFPFTNTSASAGVDRISTLPVCAPRTAPDAGRDGDGLGALVRCPRCVGVKRSWARKCDAGLPSGVGRSGRGGREIDDRRVHAGVLVCHRCWPRRTQKKSHRQRRQNSEDEKHRDDGPAARLLGLQFTLQHWRLCRPRLGNSAGDDDAMIRSIGSPGNAMRSTGSSTRRSRSVSGAMGATGAIGATGAVGAIGAVGAAGAGFAPVAPIAPVAPVAPVAPIAPAIAAAKSRARVGRNSGSAASATSKASRRALPCSASNSFRLSADTRFPVAASKAIAPSEYTSDASPGGRVLQPRRQLRADVRQRGRNAKACDAHGVGCQHDVAHVQQAVAHTSQGGVIDGAASDSTSATTSETDSGPRSRNTTSSESPTAYSCARYAVP